MVAPHTPKKGSVHSAHHAPFTGLLSGDSAKRSAFLILLLLLIASIAFFVYSLAMEPVIVRTLPVRFKFGSVLGLAAGSDELNFGTLKPDTAASKTVTVSASFPAQVHISAFGDGSEFIHFSSNDFLIVPGMSRDVSIVVVSPRNLNLAADKIIYNAEVVFRFEKVALPDEP